MSRSKGVVQTVQSLKTCWENIKKRTKKQFAEEKQAIYKTGGGQYKAISDPIAEQVREIIRPAVEGLSNDLDSDCIAGFDNDVEAFDEEWLRKASENVIEITEDNIEDETDGKKDNDESDKEEDVLNVLEDLN
ncbi:PREDICTED: uncharacterized protein LOC108770277 [Trachymyrmex cornetzi]|uniref:uncharacterized protein LOC108761483 n=1 Tax=Trachymyrmex cornetzi TaxID=471704 RepID=UPI00084F68BE|nr:PREDICTED: uncharacterized protein LOC108761483 [Trachymyrmex cornetzi]XP_018377275.1 PREDICTED: uncharacterized protein LOC108770277 [Trachymyrmex cornetzi]